MRLVFSSVQGKEDVNLQTEAGRLAELTGFSSEAAEQVIAHVLGAGAARSPANDNIDAQMGRCGPLRSLQHEATEGLQERRSVRVAGSKQAEPIMASYMCGANGP